MTDPAFWQPALARAQLWRTILGTVLISAIWIGFSFGLIWLGARVSGLTFAMVTDPQSWGGAAMFFLTFIGIHLGLALVLPLLHRRGYVSLFGPARRLNRTHLALGLLVILVIASVLYGLVGIEHLVLPKGFSPDIRPLNPIGDWLFGLLPALALILLQTSAEEALFRGYLLQQLHARFRSPLAWAVAPALVFGLLHFDPLTYGWVNATAYVLNAAIMGAMAAFVTVRTGNLAAAIGLHFGNNVTMVVFGIDGQLDGFSLYGIAMDPASGYATYSIVTQTVVYLAVFAVWWRWMARHRPIAKAGRGA